MAALLHLPLGPLRRLRQRQWEGARSCNLAVWRADLDRVDGFDAAYSGWGKEDSDIIVRLLHAGVRRKDGSFATGVIASVARAKPTAGSWRRTSEARRRIVSGDGMRARRGLSATTDNAATDRVAS